MESFLSTTDLFIFFGSLAAVMGFGLWAGRRKESSEDYFLAGRTTRWWGVAGSIFGSNVSANHIAGMMGVGYLVGFAQSQFEITAIAGLLSSPRHELAAGWKVGALFFAALCCK